MNSGLFGFIPKRGVKRAELVQNFVPRSRVGIFRNERTRSTPLDPKLVFWCISYYLTHPIHPHFGAFRSIWVHSEPFGCLTKLGAKRAELVQKFVPRSRVEIFRNERTRSIPLDPQTDVLVRFVLFGCILGRLVALRNSVQNGPKKCKSSCHEVVSEFFAMNMPNPPHWTVN